MFAGVMFAGPLGLVSAETRAVPAAARGAASVDQPDHRRAACACARHRSEGFGRHAAAPAEPRHRRAYEGGLDSIWRDRLVDDGRHSRRARRLLSRRTVHSLATGTGPNAADEAYSRTMAFTTLMMFQLFDVYNCRSRRRSAFMGFLENKWLLAAVAFSLGTHILVVYVPFLQTAFHTVPLSLADWPWRRALPPRCSLSSGWSRSCCASSGGRCRGRWRRPLRGKRPRLVVRATMQQAIPRPPPSGMRGGKLH